MNYEIIVLACKFTDWCVLPFIHQFKKFGGTKVSLVAEEDYSKGKCDFIKLPRNLVIDGECPKYYFSNSLIYGLRKVSSRNVVILLADYFINKYVDASLLDQASEYMSQNNNILRIDVGNQTKPNPFNQVNEFLFECAATRDCFHPTSLCPGMWDKHLLLDILNVEWNPWETESLTYKKFLENKNLRSLWSIPSIEYINVMRARNNTDIYMTKDVHKEIGCMIPSHFKFNL